MQIMAITVPAELRIFRLARQYRGTEEFRESALDFTTVVDVIHRAASSLSGDSVRAVSIREYVNGYLENEMTFTKEHLQQGGVAGLIEEWHHDDGGQRKDGASDLDTILDLAPGQFGYGKRWPAEREDPDPVVEQAIQKLDQLRRAFEAGAISEEEFETRAGIKLPQVTTNDMLADVALLAAEAGGLTACQLFETAMQQLYSRIRNEDAQPKVIAAWAAAMSLYRALPIEVRR